MSAGLTTEVTNLATNHTHCLLIDLTPGPRILVDCPLDPLSLTNFPVARNGQWGSVNASRVKIGGVGRGNVQFAEYGMVDPATVDCVVLTNFHNILALPFFIEEHAPFEGAILATEPTAQLGKLLMEELASYIGSASSSVWSLSSQNFGTNWSSDSRAMYTQSSVERCVARIKRLNFGQSIEITGGFVFTPHPSGYCLGSANWEIRSATHRISLIGASSLSPATRHPKPFAYQSLMHVDLAIIGDLIPRERDYPVSPPGAAPDTTHWPINDICRGVGETLLRGGNVLLPAQPCGTALDLIHALGLHMARADMHLVHTHMYFVSPVAQGIMGYLEILAEWVSASRRDRVYIPESPFLHSDFQQSNRLHIVPEVYELSGKSYVEPCVVIAGHPCLRFGPALHFLRRWGQKPENAVILTDAYWNSVRGDNGWHLLQPHQPLQMKKMCAPLDSRLTVGQAQKLLAEMSPVSVVAPSHWFPRSEASTVTCYDAYLSSASVASPVQAVPALMHVDLACDVRLAPVGDVPASSISCRLTERDGRLTLSHLDDRKLQQDVLMGSLSVSSLVSALVRRNVDDCEVLPGVTDTGVMFVVRSVALGAEVHVMANSCKVLTGLSGVGLEGRLESESRGAGTQGGEDWVMRARVMHDAVMELLVRV